MWIVGIQTKPWLCFKDQQEAVLALRLNCLPQGSPKKQEEKQGKKRLRVKNAFSNLQHTP